MRGELVAIDLETTGLDPGYDAIIEVGAVRMKDGNIVDEFSTLVNPGRAIPPHITHLTGIQRDDVVGAPGIDAVIPAISAFAGSAPLIGHNIAFDTSFLYPHGILKPNPRVDTYDLASVLLPRAPRYSLGSLAAQMGIIQQTAHRALGDAQAAALLYWELWKKALALPLNTLSEIFAAANGLNWDARIVLEAALRERVPDEPAEETRSLVDVFGTPPHEEKALRPNDVIEGLNVDAVTALIDREGDLSRTMPGYEYRPQQVEMVRAVTEAFNNAQHTMIEAGTGTGKSLAYLIPSVLWSTLNNERVIISTNTINLQDQLMTQDIPMLREALNVPFQAAVMKGRGNYLCPRRLSAVRSRRPTNVDELRTLAKILVWLLESNTGDKGEINLRGWAEHITWQRLSAEDENCTLDRCRVAMEGACPFYKARKRAESANILVVNHALLISDAASESHVLPDYRYLVIDEAHHLEDATTNGLSFSLDEATLRRRLDDLGDSKRGLLGELLRNGHTHIPDKDLHKLETFVKHIGSATVAMKMHIAAFFNAVRSFAGESIGERSIEYSTQLRITSEQRAQSSFAEIQVAWAVLQEFLAVIAESLRHLNAALGRMEQFEIADYDDLVSGVGTAARYLNDVKKLLIEFTTEPDDNVIYWVNVSQNPGQFSLHAAPLHVGPLVEKHLWNAKEAVVLTSATLQTNGRFDYIRERLNADSVATVEVGSPFNYRESTLVFIPTDIPEPNDRQHYQQSVERGLIELAAALDGRILGLFTSYKQLRETAQAIGPRLALGNITVYDQSDGSSRQALLEGFKTTERAVLLGTRSFWEGVDIPGDSLSALAIIRLPFAVPTDPIFAARSETYANSFNDYAIPEAILRFRQGFGRLIRTKTDRGIVTIFDSRITSKSYGMSFLEALPDCTVQYGALGELAEAAQNWLKRV